MADKYKTTTLRALILSLLAILLVVGVGYKLLEWNTVKTLAELHQKSWTNELSLVEEGGKKQEDSLVLIAKLWTDQKLKNQDIIDILNKLTSEIKLLTENQTTYLQILKKNQEEYKKLNSPTSLLLVGKTGRLTFDILSHQTEYYKKEIESVDRGLVSIYLVANTFNVWREWIVLNDFAAKTQVSPEVNYTKYFPDIAVLEKYTKDTFKFDEEDKIIQSYPENYEYLSKSKKYFSTFYGIAKDYVAGDYESVQYKWPRLSQESVEINPDFNRLFSEGEKESVEQSKKVAESIFDLVKTLKEFDESKLGKYPVLGQVGAWKDDLILCQLYHYKSSIFNTVTKKFPEATTTDDLLKELNQVAPRTETLNTKFDRNALKLTNDDKMMKFECVDSDQNKTYTFKIMK